MITLFLGLGLAVAPLHSFLAGDAEDARGVPVAFCGQWHGYWLALGAPAGDPPRVRVVYVGLEADALPIVMEEWVAYDPGFRGGVQVACRFHGDDVIIITTPSGEGGPHVRTWRAPLRVP